MIHSLIRVYVYVCHLELSISIYSQRASSAQSQSSERWYDWAIAWRAWLVRWRHTLQPMPGRPNNQWCAWEIGIWTSAM